MTIDAAFERLGKSKFRSRFKLTAADRAYIDRVGMARLAIRMGLKLANRV